MILKHEYKQDGYIITYVKHRDGVYIYKKTPYLYDNGSVIKDANDMRHHFEVVKPKKRSGSAFGEGYGYPSDSDWGVYGWTVNTLDRAEKKMNELLNLHK